MLQPAPRVLPSNAPPLRDGSETVQQTSRVLQEHSGNRQYTDYIASAGYDAQKYQASVQIENAYQGHPQHQPSQASKLHYPQSRYSSGYSSSRQGYGYAPGEDDRLVVRKATALYQRFRASEQYMKYRSRQHKEEKGGHEQKWPDHLEEAFFRALVKYPPMGRRKALHKDKQRGRNELIADHIQELTGEARTRKQVSSHIQVLKPFVENDPHIMRYLSKEDMGGMTSSRHYSGPHGAGWSGRRMSTYPATLPYATRSSAQSLPQMEVETVRKLKHKPDMFEPVNFSMFVQRKIELSNGKTEEERLHTYTQWMDNQPVADIQYPDWQTLAMDYPLLNTMHAQKTLDCNVVVADASLGFPTETFKDKSGVELGIRFECSSRHLSPNAKVRYRNTFYKKGQRIAEEEYEAQFQYADDQRSVTTSLKYGSTHWAKTLHHLYMRLTREPAETSQELHEEVRNYISSITAVVEVIVLSQHGHERILVMCWKFRKSSQVIGRTSWRRLVLPQLVTPSVTQYPEPSKSERVDSMYDYNTQYAYAPAVAQIASHPTLQSPFEYDSSSGSALSSATWQTSFSEGSVNAVSTGNNDFPTDNSFDFNAGSINLAYDPSLDFSNFDGTFDSSTLDFGTAVDFSQDPALDQYTQHWCNNYVTGFDGQAPLSVVAADTHSAPQIRLDTQARAYDEYVAQYDQQTYTAAPLEQQAYGGAGQDGLKEDPLGALANASYLHSMLPNQESM